MLIQLDFELLNYTAENNCWFDIQIHSKKLRPGWHELCYITSFIWPNLKGLKRNFTLRKGQNISDCRGIIVLWWNFFNVELSKGTLTITRKGFLGDVGGNRNKKNCLLAHVRRIKIISTYFAYFFNRITTDLVKNVLLLIMSEEKKNQKSVCFLVGATLILSEDSSNKEYSEGALREIFICIFQSDNFFFSNV